MSHAGVRVEKDSLNEVAIPTGILWGAQTQRPLEHFSIGTGLILQKIPVYASERRGAGHGHGMTATSVDLGIRFGFIVPKTGSFTASTRRRSSNAKQYA